MSYATVEKALLTAIQTTDEFNARNSSIADPKVLARGNKQACIVHYGGQQTELNASPNRWAFHWVIIVDLWFQGDGEFSFYNELIGSSVQSVLTAVLGFPTLNSTAGVTHVVPRDASEPDKWTGSGAKNWWRVSFPIRVTEMQTVALSE